MNLSVHSDKHSLDLGQELDKLHSFCRTQDAQRGRQGIRVFRIGSHHGGAHAAPGRVARARVDDVMVAFSVELEEFFVIPGGDQAGIGQPDNSERLAFAAGVFDACLLYTSPSPRD